MIVLAAPPPIGYHNGHALELTRREITARGWEDSPVTRRGSSVDSARASALLSRQRVSEQVFDSLVTSILTGAFRPGEPLPTQRELGHQLGVSPLLVRQAIHRLEELGLVRVRQGSPTIVLDPDTSTDIRVLQHRIEAAPNNLQLIGAVLEVQALTALPLLFLAERRGIEAELQTLERLCDELSDHATPSDVNRFLTQYWITVGQATRNPLLQHQLRWWWALAEQVRQRGRGIPARGVPPSALRHNYRKVTAALQAGRGSLQTYLAALEPLFSWLDAVKLPSGAPRTAAKRSTRAAKRRS